MLKLLLSCVLFAEVLFFSQLPYFHSSVATSKVINSIFNGFSTGLFMGIAFLHIIPEANEKLVHLGQFFSDSHQHSGHSHQHESPHVHQHSIPYGSLVAICAFLMIYALEAMLHESGNHSHNHNHSHHAH